MIVVKTFLKFVGSMYAIALIALLFMILMFKTLAFIV